MKKFGLFALIVILIVSMTACAAGPNVVADDLDEDAEAAGFWKGLWQGFIAPFAFIVSLFSDKVGIYEIFNNGNWYNFGYLFGLSIFFGGGGGAACSSSRRDR